MCIRDRCVCARARARALENQTVLTTGSVGGDHVTGSTETAWKAEGGTAVHVVTTLTALFAYAAMNSTFNKAQ